jgi:G patch domain-containing protein 1
MMSGVHFVSIGTPVDVSDSGSVKKPFHLQEVRDDKGRQRLHGAFQGGFSAGYYNTVGSKEGWQPKQFKSSRLNREEYSSRKEDFMDGEDIEQFGASLAMHKDFDIQKSAQEQLKFGYI